MRRTTGTHVQVAATYHCNQYRWDVIQVLYHHHTTTVLRPFVRNHLDELVPEKNFWTLWCKGRLTEADTLTIRLGATPFRLTSAHLHHSPIFFLQAGCVKALKAIQVNIQVNCTGYSYTLLQSVQVRRTTNTRTGGRNIPLQSVQVRRNTGTHTGGRYVPLQYRWDIIQVHVQVTTTYHCNQYRYTYRWPQLTTAISTGEMYYRYRWTAVVAIYNCCQYWYITNYTVCHNYRNPSVIVA